MTKKAIDNFHKYIAVTTYENRGNRDVKISPLRVTDHEETTIREHADKYANGNIADWMRMACLHFNPEKEAFFDA